jgi:hypothetical protein
MQANPAFERSCANGTQPTRLYVRRLKSVDTLLYILLVLAFGFALGSSLHHRAHAFQNSGEARLSQATRENSVPR